MLGQNVGIPNPMAKVYKHTEHRCAAWHVSLMLVPPYTEIADYDSTLYFPILVHPFKKQNPSHPSDSVVYVATLSMFISTSVLSRCNIVNHPNDSHNNLEVRA